MSKNIIHKKIRNFEKKNKKRRFKCWKPSTLRFPFPPLLLLPILGWIHWERQALVLWTQGNSIHLQTASIFSGDILFVFRRLYHPRNMKNILERIFEMHRKKKLGMHWMPNGVLFPWMEVMFPHTDRHIDEKYKSSSLFVRHGGEAKEDFIRPSAVARNRRAMRSCEDQMLDVLDTSPIRWSLKSLFSNVQVQYHTDGALWQQFLYSFMLQAKTLGFPHGRLCSTPCSCVSRTSHSSSGSSKSASTFGSCYP